MVTEEEGPVFPLLVGRALVRPSQGTVPVLVLNLSEENQEVLCGSILASFHEMVEVTSELRGGAAIAEGTH